MNAILDVQSELSLPGGGCAVEALVRRAAELNLGGLALADRGTLAAAPAFIRAARTAGVEPRVGVRIAVRGTHGLDLLVFPRTSRALGAIGALAAIHSLSPTDLEEAGGEEALVALAVVPPPSAADRAALEKVQVALRSLVSVLGSGLALAIPGARSPLLVELGRELSLRSVLAPPVSIVEAEDALLHRLLVLIRGDHESGGDTPRPGRPAPAPGSLVAAARELAQALAPQEVAACEATREFMERLAPADALIEREPADPVREAEDMELLRARVLAVSAAGRQLPAASRLEAEIEALNRRRAVTPALKLAEITHSLAERVHLGVSSGWSESWVGWVVGLRDAPPDPAGLAPAWIDGHDPLPAGQIEMGEPGARAARALLELAGAQETLAPRRLTAAEAARWLAQRRGFEAGAIRRLVATVEGRARPDERPPRGARSLTSLAIRLAGRVLAIEPDADIRVWSPFSTPGRSLDRLTSDATASGGLAVRVTASPTLTILERAHLSAHALSAAPSHLAAHAPRADPSRPAAHVPQAAPPHLDAHLLPHAPSDAGVEWGELADLLAGPLAGRGGALFARALRQRKPDTVAALARCLALARRAPDAPAPRLHGVAPEAKVGDELIFQRDVIAALRAHGVTDRTARDLLARAATGRGAVIAAVRPHLARELDQAAEPPERADAILGALVRIVPHLDDQGIWMARAGALNTLGGLARHSPALVAAILADLFPARQQAIKVWASERRVAFLRADLNASAIDSCVATGQSGGSLVRLGLVHLAGLDRAIAGVIAGIRGDRPFASRNDLVRRLRGRIPEVRLKALAGEVPLGTLGEASARARAGARRRGQRTPEPPSIGARRRSPGAHPSDNQPGSSLPSLFRVIGGGAEAPGTPLRLETNRDRMQFDLFATTPEGPRIFAASFSRYGILSVDRAAAAPEGSRLRTVGVIRAVRGVVTRAGRHLAAARLEDCGTGLDLLLLPALLEASDDLPLGRPVVIDGRVGSREGRPELIVESAVPLELLSSVAQPGLEVVLPAGFRRLRALKLRLLQSPGRSPLTVRSRGRERAVVAAAAALSRLAVTPDDSLIADLRRMVGDENVYLVGVPADRAGINPASGATTTAGAA